MCILPSLWNELVGTLKVDSLQEFGDESIMAFTKGFHDKLLIPK